MNEMRLEQTLELYRPIGVQTVQPTYLVVGDLERLSSTALYCEGKNLVKRDGTIETVLPKFVGNNSVKIYIDPSTGKVDAGYQKSGESHRDYSNSERIIGLDRGSKS